jgi:thioredoxin 2
MSTLHLDNRGVIVTCPKCSRKNRIAFERLAQPARCAECKQNLAAPAEPIEASSTAEFDDLIGKSSLPVVVDYWAPWCGPCRMVAPELAKVALRQAGRLVVVKVNTDALAELGNRFGIRSIPTLAVFANGREIARTTGARPAAEVEAFIDQAIHATHQ